jgi:plasmid stability protein
MAPLLIRHLDADVKAKLDLRARRHGHSLEEEVREILRNAVRDEGNAQEPLGSRIASRFAGNGLTQDIPELRGEPARPPRDLAETLIAIGERCSALPDLDGREAEEILGYDENGVFRWGPSKSEPR